MEVFCFLPISYLEILAYAFMLTNYCLPVHVHLDHVSWSFLVLMCIGYVGGSLGRARLGVHII